MLSQEGLREIVERQGWWMRPPALGLWLLLASSLLLVVPLLAVLTVAQPAATIPRQASTEEATTTPHGPWRAELLRP